MSYIGDYAEDFATLNFKFTTVDASGVPTVLAGTPVISVYKANGTTQSTAGITLTVDFDTVVGLNNVLIDLSADAFYAVANDYHVVITTGTVDGSSVVGYVVAEFSIENRFVRGTDSAALASVCTETRLSELDAGSGGKAANQIDLIKTEADKIAAADAGAGVAGSVIEEVENRATPAQVATELATYDGPTRAEATSDKDEIITHLPGAVKKNTALANFPFLMVDDTDHVTPKTGLTITGTRSIDGAAFAALANEESEVANGIYKVNLAASDLNGDTIVLRFTATNADDLLITILTKP